MVLRHGLVGFPLLLLFAGSATAEAADSGEAQVWDEIGPGQHNAAVVPIHGTITNITRDSLKRRVQAAKDAGADVIVLEMDTPGGMVTSALDMCNFLKGLDRPTLAWVRSKAYSAGTLISVACDGIVTAAPANLGDAAPISMGGKLEGMKRKKIESPILNSFWDSAERNGYSKVLVEAMVRLGPAIYEIRNERTDETKYVWADQLKQYGIEPPPGSFRKPRKSPGKEPKRDRPVPGPGRAAVALAAASGGWSIVGDAVNPPNTLLTLSEREAIDLGFSAGIVDSEKALAEFVRDADGSLRRMETTWSEDVANWLRTPQVRGLLMVVFLLSTYMALSSPGLGLPEAAAVATLALTLGAPYLAGLASVVDIVLVVAGVALLLVEVFVIPGFGLAGLAGLLLLLGGLVLTFVPAEPDPGWLPSLDTTWRSLKTGALTVLVSIVIAGGCVALLTPFFGSLPLLDRLVLREASGEAEATDRDEASRPTPPASGPTAPAGPSPEIAPGDTGEVVGGLRPVGRARIHGKLVDVVARGDWIEAGRSVRVVHVRGNRVVVEEA